MNIVGIVSTRREVFDDDVGRGAAAGPRGDTGATGGERLQQREADQPKEWQTATAQREQLPDEADDEQKRKEAASTRPES